MHIDTANRIAKFNEQQLEQHLEKSGYSDMKIVEIISVDVRQNDVKYKVEFEDDGSFAGDEPIGNLFVTESVEVCDKTGENAYLVNIEF